MTTEIRQALIASEIDNDLRESFEQSLSEGYSYANFLDDYFFSVNDSGESDSFGLARSATLKGSGDKRHTPLSSTVKD
ncbi:MAG: hypothetical protein LBG58_00100 [Planctomycetaceae bacterium]|jgi:hypothetical protein|nr:hypothetical protein [Planctomycetaceae bacterium]